MLVCLQWLRSVTTTYTSISFTYDISVSILTLLDTSPICLKHFLKIQYNYMKHISTYNVKT
ncbi:hypothetical protein GYH30_057337 [Glycine max]|uniref:Uncharacterized protein n=1 Tax=Glycine max TaxID=3847 RepID=A0A0R0E3I5_SOYBN|nr:hypothetical protein GYH30_057337 [Glycine max]